ncbi:MAG TPA: cobalamin-binding protein [Longimicrobiales bacterium]|nr:cobalamin-binding protein [Longimicrobiales bacterium]
MARAQRIASFLASGTEIVAALGMSSRLVAISHECDYPPEVLGRPRLSRPRFDPAGLSSGAIDAAVRAALGEHGSVYEIDRDTLLQVRPDLVLTQAVCEVCAVPTAGVRDVVAGSGLAARVLSLDAHTIGGILDTIAEVGAAAGVPGEARTLIESLRARLAAVRAGVGNAPRPRVLAIEWLEPPFAPGHWVPEMIEAAGGTSLVGAAGAPSRQVAWSDLAGLDPDVLIVMPCGYGLEASRAEAARFATELDRIAPRAIADGRAFAVDGSSYFNRSGPRVVTGVEILATLLHPERFPAPVPGADPGATARLSW